MLQKWQSIAVLFFFITILSQAQNSTIRGTVRDEASGEPLIFTNVFLSGTKYLAATDVNGIYSLPNIPPGDYTLISYSLGYDSTVIEISVSGSKVLTQNIFLKEKTINLDEVTISSARLEKETEVSVSKTTINVQQVKLLPSVGGEPDIVQMLQVVPGVIFTGDQGGQIYIRGGSPVQTKVLLDGITIYNPFHSIGLFSVFETEAIKSFDVLTGGFNSEYGQRISAVVDIKTRDGNRKRTSGLLSGSPFLSKALLEGPIKGKNKEYATVSYLLTGKYSYLDRTSKSLYSYVDNGSIPFSFRDFYGKLAINTQGGSKFNLFGFHFNDRATIGEDAVYEWNSLGFGTSFLVVPGQAGTIMGGRFAYSDYDIVLTESDGRPRNSSIGGFNVGLDFTYYIPDGEFKYGFNINGFRTVFEFVNQLDLVVDQNQNTTELGAFFYFRKAIKRKFVLESGIRFDYYASLSNISAEPRLGLKYNATKWLRFKAAAGMYAQNIISTRTDRDVVDLFTGFLSGPEEDLLRPDGSSADHRLQKSIHLIGGLEFEPVKDFQISVEPYVKYFTQLIEINRSKVFPDESDYELETGIAKGLDWLITYDWKQFHCWVTYSLSWVERDNGEQIYNPHYDRRHNVNIVLAYSFGKQLGWEAGIRWNLGTGFPFTRTQGYYPDLGSNYLNGGINTDYVTANSSSQNGLGILFEDDLNAGRLPTYHRLDFSLKKIFRINENLKFEVSASVSNVYNRDNIFYVNRIENQRVNQLPILPSLTASFSF